MKLHSSFYRFQANKFLTITFILLPILCSQALAADKKGTTETIGDILQYGLPAIAYSSTFLLDDADGRNEFYWSFFSNVLATQALKHSINKERPNKEDNDSFPSGHTSMAFQAAGFIHFRYGLEYGIPAYLAASYVGWGREKINEHDKTDVIAGAAIGLLSSYLFTSPYKNLQVSTFTDENSDIGLLLSYNW